MPESQPGNLAPTVFVLFGATRDPSRRTVLPAFFELASEVCCRGTGGWWVTGAATSPTRTSPAPVAICAGARTKDDDEVGELLSGIERLVGE